MKTGAAACLDTTVAGNFLPPVMASVHVGYVSNETAEESLMSTVRIISPAIFSRRSFFSWRTLKEEEIYGKVKTKHWQQFLFPGLKYFISDQSYKDQTKDQRKDQFWIGIKQINQLKINSKYSNDKISINWRYKSIENLENQDQSDRRPIYLFNTRSNVHHSKIKQSKIKGASF